MRATSDPFKGAPCAYVRNANPVKQKQNGDSREEPWEVRVESVDAKVGTCDARVLGRWDVRNNSGLSHGALAMSKACK